MMKKKIIWCIAIAFSIIILDRYCLMPERSKQVWVNDRGRNLGDPIAYDHDFLIKGNKIFFKKNKNQEDFPAIYENRKSEFYFAGCYFGYLYIYDMVRNELIVYSLS